MVVFYKFIKVIKTLLFSTICHLSLLRLKQNLTSFYKHLFQKNTLMLIFSLNFIDYLDKFIQLVDIFRFFDLAIVKYFNEELPLPN